MYKYEVVNCNDEIETVVDTFESEFNDLTSYDDRTPIAIDSTSYIRLMEMGDKIALQKILDILGICTYAAAYDSNQIAGIMFALNEHLRDILADA